MPTYDYVCEACEHTWEEFKSIKAEPTKKCPSCGKETMQRMISAPVFRLKGSGWYETDFKSEKEQKRNIAGEPEVAAPEKKDGDDPGIEIFLRVCQFVNPRHERFRGEDVLVFDFEPNPEYKSRSLVESIVQKLAGVVWIDEKAHQVARIEAYFVGDAKIGGGLLANLQKGSSFIDEQAFINNEVWLPTYQEAHIGARFLLVKGIKVNEVTRYSDYKRFNVETLNTISKPKEPKATDQPSNPQ